MPTHSISFTVLATAFATLATGPLAFADHHDRHVYKKEKERSEPHEDSRGSNLDQVARDLARETGGRVLSAETRHERGRAVHRIKILLPSGAVRVYQIDAR